MLEQFKRYHSNPNEIAALDALAKPSEYSGLVKMDERLIEYQLSLLPSFESYRTWTVYRSEDGKWTVRLIAWHRSETYRMALDGADTYGSDAILSSESASELSEQLSSISIPAFKIPPTLGIDGVTYGVSKSGFLHCAELCWWCEPPEGWEELGEWFETAVDTFDAALPELTPED